MADIPQENPQLAKLSRRIPGADPALLCDLLEGALSFILAYTGQGELPQGLLSAQVTLAAAKYNALGLEGQSAHAEGGVSVSIDSLPPALREELNRYRLAKAGW